MEPTCTHSEPPATDLNLRRVLLALIRRLWRLEARVTAIEASDVDGLAVRIAELEDLAADRDEGDAS